MFHSRAVSAAALVLGASAAAPAGPVPGDDGIWISPAEIAALPMEGVAWENLLAVANEPAGTPDIKDIDDNVDVRVLAKALVYVRTGNSTYRQQVIQACFAAMGTEQGGTTLGLSRNLLSYVIAADLVGLPQFIDTSFRAWLDSVRYADLSGRTLIGTHEERPNNWGTHAGATRMAVALYLGDDADFEAAATVFRGWLGDRDTYADFDYGELWWQADPEEPVAINPPDTFIDGHPVGGVLPDDQRRGGPFTWPPPQVIYVWEALQGALAQAVILSRHGYDDVWQWQDQALLRAVLWLHAHPLYTAVGDDTWQPHLINHFYGTAFPVVYPAEPGKNVGWTDWTHPGGCPGDLDGDLIVGNTDLLALFTAWGTDPGGPPDLNYSGSVGAGDFLLLLSQWGVCE